MQKNLFLCKEMVAIVVFLFVLLWRNLLGENKLPSSHNSFSVPSSVLFRDEDLNFSTDMDEYRRKIGSEIFCRRLFSPHKNENVFRRGANDVKNENINTSDLKFVSEVFVVITVFHLTCFLFRFMSVLYHI